MIATAVRRAAALAALVLAAPFAPAEPLPTRPDLVRGELENGIEYLILPHDAPNGRVAVWMRLGAGSLHETDEERGAAHFLEHLSYAGGRRLPADRLGPFLNGLGLRLGPGISSEAGLLDTVFSLSIPEDDEESLVAALLWYADILDGLDFAEERVNLIRPELASEMAVDPTPEFRVREAMLRELAPGSLYAARPPRGEVGQHLRITIDALRSFADRCYATGGASIIIVGDVEPGVVAESIRGLLGPLEAVPAPGTPDAGVAPTPDRRTLVVTDEALTGASVGLFRVMEPTGAVRTRERFRSLIIDSLVQLVMNRRMRTVMFDRADGAVRDAQAVTSTIAGVMDFTRIGASCPPDEWRGALDAIAAEFQRAARHGIYDSEFDHARESILELARRSIDMADGFESPVLAASISSSLANGLSILSEAQNLEVAETALDAIAREDVERRIREVYDADRVVAVLTTPPGPSTPGDAEIRSALDGALAADTPPNPAFDRPAGILDAPPEPGAVAESETHEASGVTSAWLTNNVRVHHRRVDEPAGRVFLTASAAMGSLLEPDEDRGLSEAVAAAWSGPSTRSRSALDLAETMGSAEMNIAGESALDSVALRVDVPADSARTAFEAAYALLSEPRVDERLFALWRDAQAAQAAQRRASVQGFMQVAFPESILPPGDDRMRPLSADAYRALDAERAQLWLERRVLPAPLEVSVVGDIDADEAMRLAAAYLGALPERARIGVAELAGLRRFQRPEGPIERRFELESDPRLGAYVAGWYSVGQNDAEAARALLVAERLISRRLIEFARSGGLGTVYNVVAQSSPGSAVPDAGVFFAAAMGAPASLRTIADAFEAAWTDLASGPAPDAEFSEARDQVLQGVEQTRASAAYWGPMLSSLDYRRRSLDDIAGDPAAIAELTPEDVFRAIEAIATPERSFRITVAPVAAQAPTPAPAPAPAR